MNRQASIPLCKLAIVTLSMIGAADARAQDNAVSVTVAEVESTSMAPRVPAAGTVFSRNQTQITAGIAGRLEWVAEPGDLLNAGQAVARFDCEMLELQRERQVAEADRAGINHRALSSEVERHEALRDSSVISEIERERTIANRDLAASELRIAHIAIRETESQLRRCVVTAPFSGVVTERLQRAGEDVERSTVIAAMTDTQNLEIRASVPIRYLPRMRTGELAEVSLSAIQLEGRIRKIVPAANSQSQTFEVRLDLPDGRLLARRGRPARERRPAVDRECRPYRAARRRRAPRRRHLRHAHRQRRDGRESRGRSHRGKRRLRRGARQSAVRRPHRRSRSRGTR